MSSIVERGLSIFKSLNDMRDKIKHQDHISDTTTDVDNNMIRRTKTTTIYESGYKLELEQFCNIKKGNFENFKTIKKITYPDGRTWTTTEQKNKLLTGNINISTTTSSHHSHTSGKEKPSSKSSRDRGKPPSKPSGADRKPSSKSSGADRKPSSKASGAGGKPPSKPSGAGGKPPSKPSGAGGKPPSKPSGAGGK